MVWLWEALGLVGFPPTLWEHVQLYQDFSLYQHNVKDAMEQYNMLRCILGQEHLGLYYDSE